MTGNEARAHKAFAVSSRAASGYFGGARSTTEARAKALESCRKVAPDCAIYAVDDALAATADAAPGSGKQ